MSDFVIQTENLVKTYASGTNEVHALRGIDLQVMKGEFIAIMGTSGSGKSTLMNLMGCLDTPTSGSYQLDGVRVEGLDKNALAAIRNEKIGFVFQGFNLLARTSALENVELPMLYDRSGRKRDTRALAIAALGRVGLAERVNHQPSELSGGQQQRVAIARALVTEPAIILADEPTGNLDTRTSTEVMALFQELNEQGITIVLVTHEPDIAVYAKRIVEIRDGRIRRDEAVKNRRNAASMILVRLATQAIRKNKMRAALTMLGIIIGVAAVIVMVAVGYGARTRIHEQINNLGTNMIVITPGSANTAGVSQGAQAFPTLSLDDVTKIRAEAQYVTAVSPVVVSRSQVVAQAGNWRTMINGVDTDYQTIRDWQRTTAPSSAPTTCAASAPSPSSAIPSRRSSSATTSRSGRTSRSPRRRSKSSAC
jgi:ABC-type lipoprotein export system ATPase subunit